MALLVSLSLSSWVWCHMSLACPSTKTHLHTVPRWLPGYQLKELSELQRQGLYAQWGPPEHVCSKESSTWTKWDFCQVILQQHVVWFVIYHWVPDVNKESQIAIVLLNQYEMDVGWLKMYFLIGYRHDNGTGLCVPELQKNKGLLWPYAGDEALNEALNVASYTTKKDLTNQHVNNKSADFL